MRERRVVIVGGGAAGFFAAITCAEVCPAARIVLLEKGPQFLSKVRISGGGRCNLTHGCFDPRELSSHYPRGGSALLGPFHQFQPQDTMAWFESRGVRLKIEADRRVFPVSDSSQTIIDCLVQTAQSHAVELLPNRGVTDASRRADGSFVLTLQNGETLACDRLMLATGGCRARSAGALATSLGHTIEPPVPSLFTFEIPVSWLRELAGISVEWVEVTVPGTGLRERGAVLITHNGLSGPAVLRLSAWGARLLHGMGYQFVLRINWVPQFGADAVAEILQKRRATQPSRLLVNSPVAPLAARLWERLVGLAGIRRDTRWADLSRSAQHRLTQQLGCTELRVTGKSLNRDEFVTCGGVRLREVNFKTLESRICPGLHFGGELLDVDGVTGGFNFQSAWTTGWIAGRAMGA
jgi:predicted Rossmann fold flavoprotein